MTDEEMTDKELVDWLRREQEYIPTLKIAADRIEELVKDQDSIRNAALREAATMAEALASEWWAEYRNIHSPHRADPHWRGMSDGADEVAAAILELIGEKK